MVQVFHGWLGKHTYTHKMNIKDKDHLWLTLGISCEELSQVFLWKKEIYKASNYLQNQTVVLSDISTILTWVYVILSKDKALQDIYCQTYFIWLSVLSVSLSFVSRFWYELVVLPRAFLYACMHSENKEIQSFVVCLTFVSFSLFLFRTFQLFTFLHLGFLTYKIIFFPNSFPMFFISTLQVQTCNFKIFFSNANK